MEDIPVVILCGGRGMRLHNETEFMPKPLVKVGNFPILWHIMKIYAHYGFTNFILCLGYKGKMIKEYFMDYEWMNSDFTITLGDKKKIQYYNSHDEIKWKITLVETGLEAMTGARIKRIEKYINTKYFMLTYGDGVANINIKKLVDFHKFHGKIGTITGVHTSSRFGELMIKNELVTQFSEKPQTKTDFINGGFFVFDKRIFKYINNNDSCIFEREALVELARNNDLAAFIHKEFWHCMDTYRDMVALNQLWENGNASWKVWK